MVTYYNKTDLTSFGEYLLSERRKVNIRGDLSKVHHADFENWLEEQRAKRRAKVSEPQEQEAPQPQAEVPQWLINHMASAPEELRAYVLKVFPERSEQSGGRLVDAFTWHLTPEGNNFWLSVHVGEWSSALRELAKQQRG
jgi:hypothetical protein